MPIDELYLDVENRMDNSLNAFLRELSGIRTGRANTSLLEGIKVDYYGTLTPVSQVASLSVPDSQMIMLQPWDKTIIPIIEKAIMSSSLGLNPSNDGNAIRVPIPPLTEERRKDLVKIVKKSTEDAKIAVRNIRRDGIESLKKMEKDKDISEDDLRKAQDQMQKITDKFVKNIDTIFSKKEKEILND